MRKVKKFGIGWCTPTEWRLITQRGGGGVLARLHPGPSTSPDVIGLKEENGLLISINQTVLITHDQVGGHPLCWDESRVLL